MNDKIYNVLMEESEITWQDIIYNLIKEEQMNPWDIDVGLLSKRYIETLKEMKEMNFFLSGKILLASALLVKIKSKHLLENEMVRFDNLLFPPPEDFDDLGEYIDPKSQRVKNIPPLGIKTPQTRKRAVSVNDLVNALEKALRIDTRKKLRVQRWANFNRPKIPEKKVDITELISETWNKITSLFSKKERITYSKLLPGEEKKDKILTLMPLLFLANEKKIDLNQEQHFGEIDINIMENSFSKKTQQSSK